MKQPDKIYLINKESGELIRLPIASDTMVYHDSTYKAYQTMGAEAMSKVCVSFGFKEIIPRSIAIAQNMINGLEDLREEYHAPGNNRRARRKIARDYQKILRNLKDHCLRHGIRLKTTGV